MSRYQYWQYIVDEDGRPLEGVNIRFYLNDNPNVEADIFISPTLGAPTKTSIVDLESDENGYFEFWVGDEFESIGGYSATQRFRLTWERAGILEGAIDNIDIFPMVFSVDESDQSGLTSAQRNKLISNALAFKWDNHVNSTFASSPHGLQPVDWTDDTDDTYNKLINNSILNYVFSVIASAGTVSLGVSGAAARYFTIESWNAYGEYFYIDILHGLGRNYPAVQVVEQSTGNVLIPYHIVSINSNTTRIWVSREFVAEVTIIG
jgi:hypothetical protein